MKKKRRLIESLEVIIAVPEPAHELVTENLLAEWGGIPYAELSIILVGLRHLSTVHQVNHWTAKSDSFYGDHLLFERIYNNTFDEIDGIAEKAMGLGNQNNVNLPLQMSQVAKLSQSYGPVATIPNSSELARRSYAAEVSFLRCVAYCVESLREKGMLTRGLDNFLAGMEDKHESHCYLLKQRCT